MHCFLKYNFVWSDNILKVLQREQIFKYITWILNMEKEGKKDLF